MISYICCQKGFPKTPETPSPYTPGSVASITILFPELEAENLTIDY